LAHIFVSDIEAFTARLATGVDRQELARFLTALADTLKKANRRDVPPQLLPTTDAFIRELQLIVMDSSFRTDKEFEALFIECVGQISWLAETIETSKELKSEYFSGILKLGVTLEKAARYLTLITPIATIKLITSTS
jgi:hypothetical protein